MKKLALIIAVLFVISCKNQPPVDYALVKGTITNYPESKVYFGEKEIKVADNGMFSDTLRFENGKYKFQDPKHRLDLYVENGFDLTINYDYVDYDNTFTLTGKGVDEYNYEIEKAKAIAEIDEEGKDVYKLEEADYKAKFDAFRALLNNKVNALPNSSQTFKTNQEKANTYYYIRKLEKFQKMHGHYAEKPGFKVSESFDKVVNDEKAALDYDNEYDFLNSKDYNALVTNYYVTKSIEENKSDTSSSWKIDLLNVLETIKSEKIRNALAYKAAKDDIKFVTDIDAYYNKFMEISTNEYHKKRVTSLYNKQLIIAKGAPSPKFVDYQNVKGGTSSLDDFKGKYIYIDVWATWCGPCKEEIPYLKEVEKKYHNKNIEFVSISIDKDKDKEKWAKMVKDLKLSGVQLRADKDFKSKFVKDYLINGIPRFILINPNGEIVKSIAPRPSSGEKLIELFNSEGI